MTTTEQILAAALELPAEERARLIDARLQSLDGEIDPITEAVREELDRRLDAYHRDPAAGSTWPEVKARLLARR
jgi:putative addiction module component (TIGR02574 family)